MRDSLFAVFTSKSGSWRRYRFSYLACGLLLLGSIISCTTPTVHQPTQPPPKPAILSQAKAVDSVLNDVTGQLHSHLQGDALTFKIRLPQSKAFQTQAVEFSQIRYLRLWIRGIGIQDRVYNEQGYVGINGDLVSTLTVAGVPRGPNRIVAVQGYDANKQPIPGAFLVGYYSSPEKPGMVQVHLKWRFWALGRILEQLLDTQPGLLTSFDPTALQLILDQIIYGNQPIGGTTYNVHPSRIDVQGIATYLQQTKGKTPTVDSIPAAWIPPAASPSIVVKNAQGGNLNSSIELQINDPASTKVTIPAGADRIAVPPIAPGTWTGTAKIAGLGGTVQSTFTLTVKPDGTVTLSKGVDGNPVVPPPVIGSIAENTGAVSFPGVVSWWGADGNTLDKTGGNNGTLQGGATYAAGKVGQAFSLNGTTGFMNTPVMPVNLPIANSAYTLSAWIKPTTTGNRGIIGWGGYGAGNQVNAFRLNGANQLLNYWWANDLTATSGDPSGAWHQVVASFDGTTRRIYADGVLLASDTPVGHNVPNASNFRIGSTNGGEFFNGLLDEVQVYNRALDSSEVATLTTPSLRSILITGDGFDPVAANNTVLFGSTPAHVAEATATTLRVVVPAAVSGANVPVKVITATQTSNSASWNVKPVPVSFTPAAAKAGDSIAIAGSGFDPSNTVVKFSSSAGSATLSATPTSVTTTSITVTVPAGAIDGTLTVETPTGSNTTAAKLKIYWIQSLTNNAAPPATQFVQRVMAMGLAWQNKMWLFGGAININFGGLNDVRTSTDGINWTEIRANGAANGFTSGRGHEALIYNDGSGEKIWILGGYTFGGRLNTVYNSSDGITWNTVLGQNCCGGTPSTPAPGGTQFGRREMFASTVFNNKMWVHGGMDDTGTYFSDVWSSTNGVLWTQVATAPGIGRRAAHVIITYNNKMWLIGGNLQGVGDQNDVWSSTDGVTWTQVLAHNAAPGANQFSPRQNHQAFVFENKMWIIGGNDAWFSSDGITWTQAHADTGFPARGWSTGFVFNNKMWMMTGVVGGGAVLNDVWRSAP